MDITTLMIGVVILLVGILILFGLRGHTGSVARPALRPLPAEAMERYAGAWDRIESHFMNAPEERFARLTHSRSHCLRSDSIH